MESRQAIDAFAALAQETRLAIFRHLVRQGPSGLPAGDIARALGVAPSTLSHHLAQLERAGLLRATRQQRQILYATDYEGTRRLLTFLTEDCCQGHPEICGEMTGAPAAGCCPPATSKTRKKEPAHETSARTRRR